MRLVLPLPPSSNRHWRHYRGRTVLTEEARAFRAQVAWLVASAQPPALPADTRWTVTATAHLPNWRRDLTNCTKELLDALAPPLGLDDRYVTRCDLTRGENDKANPRIEVQIEWEV